MNIHIGYKEIVTLILVGPLLNLLIPGIKCLFSVNRDQNAYNNVFIQMGGKIGRKWYLLNNIIIYLCVLLFSAVCHFLSNWLMYLVALPYFIIFFVLSINNFYKRMNSIFNHIRISIITAIIYAFIINAWTLIKQFDLLPFNTQTLTIEIIVNSFGLFLLFMPSKNSINNSYTKFENKNL